MDTPVPLHGGRHASLGLGQDGSGLTDEHFREVVRLVRLLPGRWFIERYEDDFGVVSMLLMQDVGDVGGPTFALFRHAREINLDLRRKGRFEPLGRFTTVGQAVGQVRDHVDHLAPVDGPSGAGNGRERRTLGATPLATVNPAAPRHEPAP